VELEERIKKFIKDNKVHMSFGQVMKNPYCPDWAANHYKVTLSFNGKRFTTYFSQGYGITKGPMAEDVLECLISDATSYEQSENFEDWTANLGFSSDSLKAKRTYGIVGKQTEKLKKFLGDYWFKILCEEA
jgi:hypothetical protein